MNRKWLVGLLGLAIVGLVVIAILVPLAPVHSGVASPALAAPGTLFDSAAFAVSGPVSSAKFLACAVPPCDCPDCK